MVVNLFKKYEWVGDVGYQILDMVSKVPMLNS